MLVFISAACSRAYVFCMMVAFNHNVMGKTLGVDFKLYVKRALIAGGAYVIGIHLTGKHGH